MMKIFQVGGCVRDALMGLEPHDFDYVVTGATPHEMESLGFKQVGKDFPVYLHPETQEEYALARLERKSGLKHTDFETKFDTSVTIEEDLIRRDLTINSIAKVVETGELVDPYGGLADLKAKVLRHTSEAFAEDPLRILRLARFNARFFDFTINVHTSVMVRCMVEEGALDHISKDRIWAETKKALLTEQPSKYFEILSLYGALPYVTNMKHGNIPQSDEMDRIVKDTESFSDERKILLRAACFFGAHWYSVQEKYNPDKKLFIKALREAKLPVDIIELATFAGEHSDELLKDQAMWQTPEKIVEVFDRMNIRIMVQKNPNFLEDIFIIMDAFDSFSSTKIAKERNRHLMEAYLDTKEFLTCEMKRFEWAEGQKPKPEQIKEMLEQIKVKNVDAAQSKFWNGIQLNVSTGTLEMAPLGVGPHQFLK